jgi:hypothetical protein
MSWLDRVPYQTRRRTDDSPPLPPPPAPPEGPKYYSGLDLGQQADFSALVVVERQVIPDPNQDTKTTYRFDVRHLHRWPLKTSYVDIVRDLKEMFAKPPLKDSTLVVDATGVGRAVVDMIRAAGIPAEFRAYQITCGSAVTGKTVAKINLVSAVQAPLCSGRLRFAEQLELTPTLTKELEMFRVRVSEDRNETFASWRERDHDDLVLALALALFVANQPGVAYAVAFG